MDDDGLLASLSAEEKEEAEGATVAIVLIVVSSCIGCTLMGIWRHRARKRRYLERMLAASKWTPPENVGARTGGASEGSTPKHRRSSGRMRAASLRDLILRRKRYSGLAGDDIAHVEDAPLPAAP